MTGFTYHYHSTYGSPPINEQYHPVRGVVVSDDGMIARLAVDGLREGYIHELSMPGVRSEDGLPLLHDVAYYTLNRIPEGERLDLAGMAAPESTQRVETVAASSPPQPKRQTTMPPAWTDGPDVTLTIATEPGLKFDTDAPSGTGNV